VNELAPPPFKAMLTTTEWAVRKGIPARTVRTWCEQGLIGRRVGGRYRLDPDEQPPEIIVERKPPRKKARTRRAIKLNNFTLD